MTHRTTLAAAAMMLGCIVSPAAAQCPPNTPNNLTASNGTSCLGVNLNWSNVGAADWYEVWRNTSNDFGSANRIALPVQSNYTDLLAVPGTVYHYWVTAWNVTCLPGDNRSGHGNHTTGYCGAPPNTPSGVQATDGTVCLHVQINWNANPNTTLFNIYRDPNGNWNNANIIGTSSDTTYNDVIALPDQLYTYWVVAQNACGDSGHNNADVGHLGTTPATPSNVQATDGQLCGLVQLTWNSVPGSPTYDIYRDPDGMLANANIIGESVDTTFYDILAGSGQVFTYWVRARNICGSGSFSDPDTGHVADDAAIPTGLTASRHECNRIHLEWNESANADVYEIFRDPDGVLANATFVGSSVNPNFDDLLVGFGDFTYWVRARNLCGNLSLPSAPDVGRKGPPAAPTDVDASEGQCARVTLTWSAAEGAVTYEVWRSLDGDLNHADRRVDLYPLVTWEDLSVDPEITYTYWVRASNPCGEGPYSSPDSGSSGTLPAPQNVSAFYDDPVVGAPKIRITWDAVLGAVQYEVWRSPTSQLNDGESIGNSINPNFNDTDASVCGRYTYWVRGLGPCGDGAWSNQDVYQFLDVDEGVDCFSVSLDWIPMSGADQCLIFRDGQHIVTLNAFVTSYNDHSATPGQTHSYWVTVYDESNSIICTSVPTPGSTIPPVAAPTGLTASDGTVCDGVDLSWDPVLDATGYHVYRNGLQLGTTSETVWHDAQAVAGALSNYTVSAEKPPCGEGDVSNPDAGFRPQLSISQQPQTQVVCAGGVAAFNIAASSDFPPIAYQWRRNGTDLPNGGNISGATTDTLTIDPVGTANAGNYRCVVSNACGGSSTSNVAGLTVHGVASGDANGDGMPDGLDIQAFVEFILNGGSPGPGSCASDFSGDGQVSTDDVPGFVGWLINQ